MKQVLDEKAVDGARLFKVLWAGDAVTWEPLENLDNAQDELQDYRLRRAAAAATAAAAGRGRKAKARGKRPHEVSHAAVPHTVTDGDAVAGGTGGQSLAAEVQAQRS